MKIKLILIVLITVLFSPISGQEVLTLLRGLPKKCVDYPWRWECEEEERKKNREPLPAPP